LKTQPLEDLIKFLNDSPKSLTMGALAKVSKTTWTGSLHAVLVKIKRPKAFDRIVKETDYFKQWKLFEDEAVKILKIVPAQAEKLFTVMSWPADLQNLKQPGPEGPRYGYWEIDGPIEMVELVTNRIRAFIESKGKR